MLDNLKWKKYYPLSDKNAYICLVDSMGNDSAIVQAARVSYNKDLQYGYDFILLDCIKEIYPEVNSYELYDSGNTTGEHSLKLIFNDGRSEISSIDFKRKIYNNANIAREKILRNDRNLIRYLMNHSHTTPFEMVEIKFMIQVPMDCWRQWIRHRTASVNEYSTRYTEALDFFQVTQPQEWRLQATDNKQGSSGLLEKWPDGYDPLTMGSFHSPGGQLSAMEEMFHEHARKVYKERLNFGIAKEQARKDLPLSTYTRAYWKCDLHNIFNFLRLRMDSHAQFEIRSFANSMFEIVKQVCPVACEAFEDYVLNAKRFSRMEIEVLKILVARGVEKQEVMQEFSYDGTVSREEANLEWHGRLRQAITETTTKPTSMTDREWKEFLSKLS